MGVRWSAEQARSYYERNRERIRAQQARYKKSAAGKVAQEAAHERYRRDRRSRGIDLNRIRPPRGLAAAAGRLRWDGLRGVLIEEQRRENRADWLELEQLRDDPDAWDWGW